MTSQMLFEQSARHDPLIIAVLPMFCTSRVSFDSGNPSVEAARTRPRD